MPELAYDSLVGEFIWLGVKPKFALKLAGQHYPGEELYLKSKTQINIYNEYVLDIWQHKYDEFDIDESFELPETLIDEIRGRKKHQRVCVYIDGSNLLRSYSFIKETTTSHEEYIERNISVNIKNYKSPVLSKLYPIWYLPWVLLPIFGMKRALLEKVVFVMCADTKKTKLLVKKIEKDFGFTIITPIKKGSGLKSSSNEDKILKELIISDLKNNIFDVAILGTGDGNKKDGISFPEIAKRIELANKRVLFSGFDLTTSKDIKNNFEFDELDFFPLFPRLGGVEIISFTKHNSG